MPYCEKVEMDEGSINYGFIILFLDEEKTVSSAAGMLTTKTACFDWKNKVQKILDNGLLIRLQGFGKIEELRVLQEFRYTFEKHGTYQRNGRSIDFFNIRNDLGECFSKYNNESCP